MNKDTKQTTIHSFTCFYLLVCAHLMVMQLASTQIVFSFIWKSFFFMVPRKSFAVCYGSRRKVLSKLYFMIQLNQALSLKLSRWCEAQTSVYYFLFNFQASLVFYMSHAKRTGTFYMQPTHYNALHILWEYCTETSRCKLKLVPDWCC